MNQKARGIALQNRQLHRAVIGAKDLAANPRSRDSLPELLRDPKVVDSPADVPLPRVTAISPPTVSAGASVELTKRIEKPGVNDLVQSRALFVGKSRVPPIRLGIRQIDFVVGTVDIATKNHRLASVQLLHVREECGIPLLPVVEPS